MEQVYHYLATFPNHCEWVQTLDRMEQVGFEYNMGEAMIDIQQSVTIERPVEEVFGFVRDVRNDPKWNQDMLAVRQSMEGAIDVGTTFDVQFKPFMGASACSMRVGAHELNRRIEFTGSPIPAIQAHSTFLFEPTDTGTRVTRRQQFQVSGWLRLVQPLMRLQLRKSQAAMLINLKRVLETGAH